MKILSIETSCDETGIAIIEANGDFENPQFKILGNALHSQIDIHKEYGGVFPKIAKREHAHNIIPMLQKAFEDASVATEKILDKNIFEEKFSKIEKILEREDGLYTLLKNFTEQNGIPKDIDLISVTSGPGLEPALWVGISFAKGLSVLWDKPLLAINHMEGHIMSVLLEEKLENTQNNKSIFPALALLISGGHTELVKINNWGSYEVIGKTKDDAVGEAYDKVARLLGLSYPGGPEIARLAKKSRSEGTQDKIELPRPMISHEGFDFSFSGLKTAVRYQIEKDFPEITEIPNEYKILIAGAFEESVKDVLIKKTREAVEKTGAKTLIVAGGVIANEYLRENLEKFSDEDVSVHFPSIKLSTDNAVMIAAAAYMNFLQNKITPTDQIRAEGNLSL